MTKWHEIVMKEDDSLSQFFRWCEKSSHSSSKPSSQVCRVIDFTLLIQVTHGSLTVCRGEQFVWKLFEVTLSKLNFCNVVAGKEMRSMCYGSILFLVRILANTGVCIDENNVRQWYSRSRNDISLARIFHCRKNLGNHITEKWLLKNIQHGDYEHDWNHNNENWSLDS